MQQPRWQKNPWPFNSHRSNPLKQENYRSDMLGNPRNLGFLSTTPTIKPSVPPDLAQKPPLSVLDRFRALLKQREDEDGGPPTTEEIVRMYGDVLSELTFNSKPIITDLTIIAGDQKDHGEAIADAICARILEVPVEQKLPSLYLLDSIVKNIGDDYVEYFAAWLLEVFCEAYKQVNTNLHPAMRHLFRTWSSVFPSSLLHQIESELQLSSPTSYQSSNFTTLRPSESPSPRQGRGIHVNLKYLKAQRHLEHSKVMQEADPARNTRISDFGGEGIEGATLVNPKGWSGASSKFHEDQLVRGVSSSGQNYGQKPRAGYIEYGFDHFEGLPSQFGDGREGSRSEWLLPTSKNKFSSPLSPSRVVAARSLSPGSNQFASDIPVAKGIERASWSHPVPTSEIRSESGKRHDHWEQFWPDDITHELESSACSNSAILNQQQPRAFAGVYRNYRGKSASLDKHMEVNQPDVNSIDNKPMVAKWQNTEEDEYDWEDMSPTIAEHNQGDDFRLFDSHIGNFSTASSLKRLNAAPEPDFRRSKWPNHVQPSGVGECAIDVEDKIHVQSSVHVTMSNKSLSGTVIHPESFTQFPNSHYSRDPQHRLHNFQPREVGLQIPLSVNRIAPASEQRMPVGEKAVDAYSPFQRPSTIQSRMRSSSVEPLNVDTPLHTMPTSTLEKHMLLKPCSPPVAPTSRALALKSHQPPSLPKFLQHKQINGQFKLMDGAHNLSWTLLDAADGKMLNSTELSLPPNQQATLISLNKSLILEPQEVQGTLTSTAAVQMPPHLLSRSLNHVCSKGQGDVWNANLSNPLPVASSASVTIPCLPNTSFQVQGFALPPLPPGLPPTTSQVGQSSQNAGSVFPPPLPGGELSGLISSLMAKGLISLPQPATSQDSIGLEFDAEILKLRHESVINALYVDLPRQCKTCGLRFKCQEEHSTHMDWHVTKNRMCKNCKQNPSRKWFVSAKEWLSSAETLGTDAVPGFLPTETIVEKREDEEMAVPADDNQNVCALCGDPFENFYSDETEEWMYRGAVYLNAPDGSIEGASRSQLGPIVHAKCRSESMGVPQNFSQDKRGNNEESSQRKRIRI